MECRPSNYTVWGADPQYNDWQWEASHCGAVAAAAAAADSDAGGVADATRSGMPTAPPLICVILSLFVVSSDIGMHCLHRHRRHHLHMFVWFNDTRDSIFYSCE